MHKGEIIAVSPKGKGKHPDYITLLLKSEDLFNLHKDHQKWVIVDNSIKSSSIKKGLCEFDISDDSTIIRIDSPKNKELIKDLKEDVVAFSKLDIFQLAKELSKLGKRRRATQVFQLNSVGKPLYDALAYLDN